MNSSEVARNGASGCNSRRLRTVLTSTRVVRSVLGPTFEASHARDETSVPLYTGGRAGAVRLADRYGQQSLLDADGLGEVLREAEAAEVEAAGLGTCGRAAGIRGVARP